MAVATGTLAAILAATAAGAAGAGGSVIASKKSAQAAKDAANAGVTKKGFEDFGDSMMTDNNMTRRPNFTLNNAIRPISFKKTPLSGQF